MPYKIQETIDAESDTTNVFFAFGVCRLFRLMSHTSLIQLFAWSTTSVPFFLKILIKSCAITRGVWNVRFDDKKKSASHNPVNGMLVPSTTTPITYAPFTRATIPAITDSIPAANTSVTISKIATHMACEVFTFFLCR